MPVGRLRSPRPFSFPSLIPGRADSRIKTDKKGSYKLARLLESNMLKKVWGVSPEERDIRKVTTLFLG